jgi:chorismate-pyruvate lyase
MSDRFQSAVDPGLDFVSLPPILRVLLLTDGTVTHSLAAYFGEEIRVQCLQQGECRPGVIAREVMLRGAITSTAYAHAYSLIQLEYLDREIQDLLAEGRVGIGELLSARNLETSRQIIRVAPCHYGPTRPDPFVSDTDSNLSGARVVVARDYIIHSQGRPVIEVTEEFPVEVYRG